MHCAYRAFACGICVGIFGYWFYSYMYTTPYTHIITEYDAHVLMQTDTRIAESLAILGKQAAHEHRYDDACALYKSALIIAPHAENVYLLYADTLRKMSKNHQAKQTCMHAIKLNSANAHAYYLLAHIYTDLNQYDAALHACSHALSLNNAEIPYYLLRGSLYQKKGLLSEALTDYQTALAHDPQHMYVHYNLGHIYYLLHDTPRALHHLDIAHTLNPQHIDTHIARAECYWQQEDFDRAWPEYEWRKQPILTNIPRWDGSSLYDKKIILHSEQGLGDTMQFLRFAQIAKNHGAYVICCVQKPLQTVLASCPFIDELITNNDSLPEADYYAPLMSMPYISHTHPYDAPKNNYISVPEYLITIWKEYLASHTGYNVGIVWHVDPIHEQEKSPVSRRSIPLAEFDVLNDIPHVQLYSLQKYDGLDELTSHTNIHIFPDDFDTTHGRFMDSAAVIMNLDLIICVDTSIAHLAAILGKEVWVLLPYTPDCRWGITNSTTPWYPTMRFFRQTSPFIWHDVFLQVHSALSERVAIYK